MGKPRPRKTEVASVEDVLSEDIGRKFVASILDDDKHGRFKVLVRCHSRKAIAAYQEPETELSLLQFACIAGNVQAGKRMLPNMTHIISRVFPHYLIPSSALKWPPLQIQGFAKAPWSTLFTQLHNCVML